MTATHSDQVQLTQIIWESVLGMKVIPSMEEVSPETVKGFQSAAVDIRGAWNGAVILDCSDALARKISATMFDTTPEDATEEEVRDALGEIANMVGGNIKALLPQPSSLSIPHVFMYGDSHERVQNDDIVSQVTLTCRQEPLRITLLKQSGDGETSTP